MKPVQIREEDHEWLNKEKDITGVPMATQIHFLIESKKESRKDETKETPILSTVPK